jgi:tRNA nucleotidyltransferase (CCA-adding enzyme)
MPIDKGELPQFHEEYDGLDVFVVGGWVRDFFREGHQPTDVDLMVAGVSEQDMLDRGFRPVNSANNDTFGVFFDSRGREVALAREEVSTGEGHRAFDVEPVPADVPVREAVERDLLRRDFTVNAMAIHRGGEFLDPHDGRFDLEDGIIRAVDEQAFVHDPLRILRGARFAARLDADVDSDTLGLMKEMTPALTTLPQERVRLH